MSDRQIWPKTGAIQVANKLPKETAWMYCRECNKFDEDGTGDCSGKPFDYEIKDGKPPCDKYEYRNR